MSRARVLAVDDQRYFRDLIEGLLGDEGYEVRTASSGAEALHVLEREEFDVVVSDLVMPGMDGAALVQRIKERLPDQEIVMVTGVVDVKSAVEAMKLGATDYIVKPFDRSHLLDSLERILQRRRLRDEHARLIGENLEIMGALSLYERAAGLFSTLSIEALSERVIEGLCLETGAQGGVLWVADAVDDPQIVLQSARGLIRLDEESKQFDFAQLGDECRAELLEGRAVVRPLTRGNASSEALYVPLRRAGALLGIARLSDKLDADGFDERDRTAAAKFAGFGAVAVVNALEFRALERRSLRDPTTRAYTLAYLHDAVRHEIQKGSRFGHRFSLIRADLDGTGDLRRGRSEAEFAHWLESLARQMGGTLRATDLLATASASSHRMLLPQTDALGSAVLENRLREVIEAALAESARAGRRAMASRCRGSPSPRPRIRPTAPSSTPSRQSSRPGSRRIARASSRRRGAVSIRSRRCSRRWPSARTPSPSRWPGRSPVLRSTTSGGVRRTAGCSSCRRPAASHRTCSSASSGWPSARRGQSS